MNENCRLFAVVPAAGHSVRMGRPKLLLEIGGVLVIRRLLDVLRHNAIVDRIVVVRRDDAELAAEAASAGATVVQPEIDPPDMRTSVERGLEYVRQRHRPLSGDGWLLVPGDHPMLDAAILELLIDCWRADPNRIVAPTCDGRQGHPTLFPWAMSGEVGRLPENSGINLLLQQHQETIREVPVESRAVLADLDTPEDFESLVRRLGDEGERA